MRKGFNILTYVIIGFLILISIFNFQYQLATGPFMGGIFYFLILLCGLIFSIIFIFVNRKTGMRTMLPVAGLILSLFISFGGLNLGISYKLFYLLNKSDFQKLESQLKKHPNLKEMTDMLRYSKRINSKYLGNYEDYRTKQELESAFGDYLNSSGIDVNLVYDIRKRMEYLNVISLTNSEQSLCLTVDGMIDNEYGFIKFYGKVPELGEGIEPFGFTLINLIHVGDNWYFFATT
ncbi:hypothetical protein [Fulvivirga ligni]|uniref:hypothetical protein n=1 Tax=Fulvivirga ligni TaxID=2904246 RepID=UPI001F177A67|nr:hypothetical protein [Fulvivirga ligni]UII22504.1 hypothetical protein LVD16_04585 [Fulvivirga ligni]